MEFAGILETCPEEAPRMLTTIERVVNTSCALLAVLGHEKAPVRKRIPGQLIGLNPGYDAPLPSAYGGAFADEEDATQDRETFGVNAFGQMMAQQQQTEAPKKLAALMSAYKDAKASGLLDVAESLEAEIREQTAIVTRQKPMPKDPRVQAIAKTFDDSERGFGAGSSLGIDTPGGGIVAAQN
jgi:hypothetical protein